MEDSEEQMKYIYRLRWGVDRTCICVVRAPVVIVNRTCICAVPVRALVVLGA